MLVPALYPRAGARRIAPRLLVPSLSDSLLLAMLLWGFATGSGWRVLLADGDTGWHIRTGELILQTHTVPTRDPFSFSKAGQPWFAWEWLADTIFAALHGFWGLKGVVVFTGLVLSLGTATLFRFAVWRGANVLAALVATLLASGAATVHYLARPHIFTLLGLTVTLWMLERDRRRETRAVWLLVPVTALWTNLHAGFLAGIACLALATAGQTWNDLRRPREKRNWRAAGRYGLVTAACTGATLANPYGWRLHQHMASYLSSGWIREVVQEFQSPRFRSESMLQFEALLFGGLLLIPVLCKQQRSAEALTVLFWAHNALVSTRHVPLYAFAAAPICAAEASRWWAGWSVRLSRRSIGGTFRDCLADFSGGQQHWSLWVPMVVSCVVLYPWAGPRDFPDNKFPVIAVQQNEAVIAAPGSAPRILTSDQWADYLIYRFYPRCRVFVDGRSDFYGPEVGRQYLDLLNAAPGWQDRLDAWSFDLALLPVEWPLGQLLLRNPDWQVRYLDAQSVLLERKRRPSLNQNPDSTERIHGSI